MMDLRDLQPGDVLNTISDPKNPLHWPIGAGTDNPFVHTAIFETGTTAISALADGVQRRPIEQWDRFILVTRFPYPHVASAALWHATKMIGVPYDVLGIIAAGVEAVTGLDLPDTNEASMICSRLIAAAYRKANAILVPAKDDADVTPRDLVEISVLDVVGYLRLR